MYLMPVFAVLCRNLRSDTRLVFSCRSYPSASVFQKERRLFKTSAKQSFSCDKLSGKELHIPTPYGHIAAVEYGDPKGHPVLAVHGWMDNLGSFEPLLLYIVKENNLHIVAIDETGCGLSSHLPKGSQYTLFSPVKDMKRVINYLGWHNFSILGHSRGAGFAVYYAVMYAESVQCLVLIDFFGSYFTKEICPFITKQSVNEILKFEEKDRLDSKCKSGKVYTEEEAIKRMIRATEFALTEKSARILMKRGAKQLDAGFVFTRDYKQNLPYTEHMPSKADFLQYVSKIRCDLLVIMASNGLFSKHDNTELFDVFNRNCRSFKEVCLRGNHFLHMDIPEQLAAHINPFFQHSIQKGAITNLKFVV